MAAAGMSAPGATDLGLGAKPADAETEDERRKRLLAMQQNKLLPNTDVAASQLMNGFGAAVSST